MCRVQSTLIEATAWSSARSDQQLESRVMEVNKESEPAIDTVPSACENTDGNRAQKRHKAMIGDGSAYRYVCKNHTLYFYQYREGHNPSSVS